jgi:hypothetical protein
LVVALTLVGVSPFGDALHDVLDPKLQETGEVSVTRDAKCGECKIGWSLATRRKHRR